MKIKITGGKLLDCSECIEQLQAEIDGFKDDYSLDESYGILRSLIETGEFGIASLRYELEKNTVYIHVSY